MKELHSSLCGLLLAALSTHTWNLSAQDAEGFHVADTIPQATVTALRPAAAYTGLVRLDSKDLLKGAALFGSPDVIKVLQNFSGVAAGMELSSGLYVHGGDGSDNLFLLDGVPLFQVTHLGGLFSVFNADAVESLSFYKSGFPAKYGGRLSSVVDVSTSDGSADKFGGSFSIGLIDGRLFLQGPIVRDKLSFSVAMRRSWLDAVLVPMIAIAARQNDMPEDTKAGYSMFDTNVGLTYTPTPRDRLSLRFYCGTDGLHYYGTDTEIQDSPEGVHRLEDKMSMALDWGNLAASASWRHLFPGGAELNALAYWSRGYSDMTGEIASESFEDGMVSSQKYNEKIFSSASVAGFKSIAVFRLDRHVLNAGIEYRHEWYDPVRTVTVSMPAAMPGSVPGMSESVFYRADGFSMFGEDEMQYGPLTLSAGLRLDLFAQGGKVYFRPQPRLSGSYALSRGLLLKASYEWTSQFTHLLSSVFLDLPTNLWLPATAKVKPADSRQVALGLHASPSRNWRIDVGGYYRTIGNCILYSGGLSLLPPLEDWESVFVSGRGRSYGAELELGYVADKFDVTAYYTLSWTTRFFPELYHDWFFDRFDNRHKLTLVSTWRIAPGVELGATWNFHSGNRVTLPEQYIVNGDGSRTLLYSMPYNAKLPAYHRLDLSCSFRSVTRRGRERIWNISVYNAYCRMNPSMIMTSIPDDGPPKAYAYSLVPILPSVSYTLKF